MVIEIQLCQISSETDLLFNSSIENEICKIHHFSQNDSIEYDYLTIFNRIYGMSPILVIILKFSLLFLSEEN